MDSNFSRRNLLNLWVSDFMFNVTRGDSSDTDLPRNFARLMAMESRDGPKTLEEYYQVVSQESKDDGLYYLARARAKRWEIPISQVGLLMAIGCCTSARDVDMFLAVLFKKFCELNSPMDHIIDGLFVWEVLLQHAPSREYLDQAWEKQVLPVEGF